MFNGDDGNDAGPKSSENSGDAAPTTSMPNPNRRGAVFIFASFIKAPKSDPSSSYDDDDDDNDDDDGDDDDDDDDEVVMIYLIEASSVVDQLSEAVVEFL